MNIEVEKRVVNTSKLQSKTFLKKDVKYCCKGIDFLYNNSYLALIDGNKESNLINFVESDNEDDNIFVGIVCNSMEDYGDYNYDDEYEPYYVEESSYIKINNCPMCGKKIEINISEVDVTSEYEAIKARYPKNMRLKVNKELKKNLDKKIIELIGAKI